MKRSLMFLLALICLLSAFGPAEESSDSAALKEKYEQSAAFFAAQTLCRVGSDELSMWACDVAVKRPSDAWSLITKFDGGWFSSVRSSSFLDMRSENWHKTDDTHFDCDVYGTNRIVFSIENKTVDFPFGFHLCFEQADARKDVWKIYDFNNLPVQSELEKAEKLSLADKGIRFEAVTGKSFRGYMMIIEDPSRLFVGTIDTFGSSRGGMRVNELAEKYKALAVINGGAFEDSSSGSKNGSRPAGLVVEGGVTKSYNAPNNTGCNVVMGFDQENKLHVGKYTNDQLAKLNLRDAVAFHTALVIDGQKTAISTKHFTYSARTAIGQDAEGRVLLFVAQGRAPDCLGASFFDLQDVMLSYGALNAGNLDGGHSTAMYFNGQSVYSAYPLDVSRRMPATFMVKPE